MLKQDLLSTPVFKKGQAKVIKILAVDKYRIFLF